MSIAYDSLHYLDQQDTAEHDIFALAHTALVMYAGHASPFPLRLLLPPLCVTGLRAQ
jgi:hypothetical protein